MLLFDCCCDERVDIDTRVADSAIVVKVGEIDIDSPSKLTRNGAIMIVAMPIISMDVCIAS